MQSSCCCGFHVPADAEADRISNALRHASAVLLQAAQAPHPRRPVHWANAEFIRGIPHHGMSTFVYYQGLAIYVQVSRSLPSLCQSHPRTVTDDGYRHAVQQGGTESVRSTTAESAWENTTQSYVGHSDEA